MGDALTEVQYQAMLNTNPYAPVQTLELPDDIWPGDVFAFDGQALVQVNHGVEVIFKGFP